MEKKKVFYLLTSMHIGGTEKALLGLLSTIDYARTEVHLGLFHKEGGFLDYIPGQGLSVQSQSFGAFAPVWNRYFS